MKKVNFIAFLLSFILLIQVVYAQTNYFIKSGGTGDGSSWDNAAGTMPVFTGNDISDIHFYIAAGEYLVNNNYDYIGGSVLIQGGFSPNAVGTDLSSYNPEVNITRITKTANTRFLDIEAKLATAYETNTIVVKGLFFKSTGATNFSGNIINAEGENLYYKLTVIDCNIHDSKSGSGLFRVASSVISNGKATLWFHNNKFYRNEMGSTGPFEFTTVNGDVKVLISKNHFGVGNSTDGTSIYFTSAGNLGLSKSRFDIIGNVFSCSTASSTTGGIYATTVGNLSIEGNVFLGIEGRNYGGGIFLTNVGGVSIKNNIFINNHTANTSVEVGGGAIAIEGGKRDGGSIISSNIIEGNIFYGNYVQSTSALTGGSAISFGGDSGGQYSIINNKFAYNKSLKSNKGAVIFVENSNNVKDIKFNVFYGNTIYNSTNNQQIEDSTTEIHLGNSNNVSGVIAYNDFQLLDASAYQANTTLYSKLSQSLNYYNTTKEQIGNINPEEYVIDCDSGSVGCVKVKAEESGITANSSRVGISSYLSIPNGWPNKDINGNDINNGALVLSSGTKPFVLTSVNNPVLKLGIDPSLKGALVYDTARECTMLFDGEQWGCLARGCDRSVYDLLPSTLVPN